MKNLQATVLAAVVPAALLGLGSGAVHGQADNFPSKPITIIVPSAGTGISQDVRVFMQSIERSNPGISMILEQKPGAASTIGASYVARAKPDGYTVLAPNTAFTIGPAMYPDLSYDVNKDFAPITLMMQKAYLLMVHSALPFKTVKEYLGYARQHPTELNFSTSSIGSSTHLPGAMLHHMTNTKVTFIHHKKSAERITDLLAGRVGAAVGTYATLLPHIKSGRLRPLAVTTSKRISSVPELPTLAEAGVPGFEYSSWTGMLAPGKTPKEIVARHNKLWNDALKDPVVIGKLATDGTLIVASTPQEFQKFIAQDSALWMKLIKETGLKSED